MKPASAPTLRIVKVSDKGQISIPVDVQRDVGIKKGDELLLFRQGTRMYLEKPDEVVGHLQDEFADVGLLAEASLSQIWLNKQDEVWNQYLKPRKR